MHHRLKDQSKARLRGLLGARSDSVVALYEALSVFADAPQQAKVLLVAKSRAGHGLSDFLDAIDGCPDLERFTSAEVADWAQWKRSVALMRDRLQTDEAPKNKGGRPLIPRRNEIGAVLAAAFNLTGIPMRVSKLSKYAKVYSVICADAEIQLPAVWNSRTIKQCIRAGIATSIELKRIPEFHALWLVGRRQYAELRLKEISTRADRQMDRAMSKIKLPAK